MARTKGALGKKTIEAMAVPIVTTDGYIEAFTGAGSSRDRSSYVRSKAVRILQQQELTDLYIGDGFARKIVDCVAEEMTRAGVYIEHKDDTEDEVIEARLQELDAMRHMNDALRWSRLFGGAVMVYGVNDGGALDTPLNPEGIKDVEFLRVYDRHQATIQARYTDPMLENYGKPELWQISPVTGGSPYTVHDSRIHAFDGEAIPDLMRQANLGWGASVLQACYEQLKRLGMGHQWANMLLERAQQAVHSIPGLTNLLRSPGGEQMMQRRVDVVDMVRSTLNTIVIDGEESYTVTSNPITGVNELLDRFAEALSAVSGYPVYILMGRSPGGLSNSDKAGEGAWQARIGSMQKDQLQKPLDRLVSYLFQAAGKGDGGDYKLCFHSLAVQSDAEKAALEKTEAETEKAKMETAKGYVEIGALDPREVRTNIAEDYEIDPAVEVVLPEPDVANV